MQIFLLALAASVIARRLDCVFNPFDARCVGFKLAKDQSLRMLDAYCDQEYGLPCTLKTLCNASQNLNDTLSIYCDPFTQLVQGCTESPVQHDSCRTIAALCREGSEVSACVSPLPITAQIAANITELCELHSDSNECVNCDGKYTPACSIVAYTSLCHLNPLAEQCVAYRQACEKNVSFLCPPQQAQVVPPPSQFEWSKDTFVEDWWRTTSWFGFLSGAAVSFLIGSSVGFVGVFRRWVKSVWAFRFEASQRLRSDDREVNVNVPSEDEEQQTLLREDNETRPLGALHHIKLFIQRNTSIALVESVSFLVYIASVILIVSGDARMILSMISGYVLSSFLVGSGLVYD